MRLHKRNDRQLKKILNYSSISTTRNVRTTMWSGGYKVSAKYKLLEWRQLQETHLTHLTHNYRSFSRRNRS